MAFGTYLRYDIVNVILDKHNSWCQMQMQLLDVFFHVFNKSSSSYRTLEFSNSISQNMRSYCSKIITSNFILMSWYCNFFLTFWVNKRAILSPSKKTYYIPSSWYLIFFHLLHLDHMLKQYVSHRSKNHKNLLFKFWSAEKITEY